MIWIHGENINKKLQKKFSQTLNLNYLKKREIFMISEYFIENINISKKKDKNGKFCSVKKFGKFYRNNMYPDPHPHQNRS